MPLTMAEPKKSTGSGSRKGKASLQIYIPTELRDAIDQAMDRTRRTLTAEVSVALETHLETMGLWPPPDAEDDAPGPPKRKKGGK